MYTKGNTLPEHVAILLFTFNSDKIVLNSSELAII